jgi:hypothetical protein
LPTACRIAISSKRNQSSCMRAGMTETQTGVRPPSNAATCKAASISFRRTSCGSSSASRWMNGSSHVDRVQWPYRYALPI